jgi:hypothetical protein
MGKQNDYINVSLSGNIIDGNVINLSYLIAQKLMHVVLGIKIIETLSSVHFSVHFWLSVVNINF